MYWYPRTMTMQQHRISLQRSWMMCAAAMMICSAAASGLAHEDKSEDWAPGTTGAAAGQQARELTSVGIMLTGNPVGDDGAVEFGVLQPGKALTATA